MSEKIKTLLFTVAVTALFTLLVSGINAVLKDRIELNRSVARQRVILGLFGLIAADRPVADSEVPVLFAEQTEPVKFASDAAFECYRRRNSGDEMFVFAFSGQGFWDNIIGFIAVDAKSLQIKGIEFTRHGETPGLGGRISEPEFKARFKERSFATKRSDGLYFRMVAEGSANRGDEIDGITGATGTSSAVEKIVNRSLAYFASLNQGGNSN
ncbi:MAG: Na(+)-translocating NADH-quinone reductase subunit C [Candidatus Rifleibacterium amylolyticum]|nr:MAG: Na(+)-translocating NADH-quinone reductase subunit C [Candidatus Rifleibacterium amylolyticum]